MKGMKFTGWSKDVLDAVRRGDFVSTPTLHRFLCHADGSECADGCDVAADPRRSEALVQASPHCYVCQGTHAPLGRITDRRHVHPECYHASR